MQKSFPATLSFFVIILLVLPAGALCSGLFHLPGESCCCAPVSAASEADACCASEAAPLPMEDCDCSFSEGTLPLCAVPFPAGTSVKPAPVQFPAAWPDEKALVDPAVVAGNYLRWLWHSQLGVGRSLYQVHSTYLC